MLININKLAKWMGVSPTTVWRLNKNGGLPPRRTLSTGRKVWLEEDIKRWFNELPEVTLKKSNRKETT